MLLFFFLLISSLQAVHVGNLSSPTLLQNGMLTKNEALFSFSTGFITDTVWNRKLHVVEDPVYISLGHVNVFKIQSNWAAFAINFLRRLSVYSYVGISKEKMEWDNRDSVGGDSSLNTKNYFSYVVGSKLILMQLGATTIALDGKYFSMPKSNEFMEKIRDIYEPITSSIRYAQHLKFEEWHIALGASHSLGPFSLYGGGKYSDVEATIKTDGSLIDIDFKNRRWFGIFGGLSVFITRGFCCNIEGRLLDEYALSFSATTSF